MASPLLNPPSSSLLPSHPKPHPHFLSPPFSLSSTTTTMKLLKSINPKQIFRLKKSSSKPLSRSAPPSFGSLSLSSTSSDSSTSSTLPTRAKSDTWPEPEPEPEPELYKFDYVQAFKMIDRDGDGKITRVELESLLKRVASITSEEVTAMIHEIDHDGDGCISLDELQTVGSVFESKIDGEDELREAFDFFDADHDGKITAEELHAVFTALGDERCTLADCRRMIAGVDKNGDGFVCFEDFTRMMDLQGQGR